MADFPADVYAPRTKENKPGIVYEVANTTVGYVEDVTKLDDEVVAIETELGANPKGAFASVAAYLASLASDVGSVISDLATHVGLINNPHSVTKTQVGLGNVDDVQQATKSEYNTYVALFGSRIIVVKIINDATVLTVGDGKVFFTIPAELNGFLLTAAHAAISTVSSSGLPTIQIRNVTDAVDMLSTKITIDETEKNSYIAATPPVIDTVHDDVATGDELAVDVDVAGTGAKGLSVILTFEPA